MQAAMTRTPFSRCLSMPETVGEQNTKVNSYNLSIGES
jgi:hypothetical protein